MHSGNVSLNKKATIWKKKYVLASSNDFTNYFMLN